MLCRTQNISLAEVPLLFASEGCKIETRYACDIIRLPALPKITVSFHCQDARPTRWRVKNSWQHNLCCTKNARVWLCTSGYPRVWEVDANASHDASAVGQARWGRKSWSSIFTVHFSQGTFTSDLRKIPRFNSHPALLWFSEVLQQPRTVFV